MWTRRAREEGVIVQVGTQFAFDGRSLPYLRLGFARHDPRELLDAVRRLARARPRRTGRVPGPA